MKLWMSEIVQADVGQAYAAARRQIEGKINDSIRNRDYGGSVERWSHVAVLSPFDVSGSEEVHRFSKAKKTVDFRLEINHAEFKLASNEEQKKLIVDSLLQSIKMMPQLNIKGFDWQALLREVQSVAAENGWMPDHESSVAAQAPDALCRVGTSNGDAQAPSVIAINRDNDCAKYVGRTADGRQFFLTTPFLPARRGNPGCEFIALYIFDSEGGLREARVDKLGPRDQIDPAHARQLIQQRLAELGAVEHGRIEVRPFQVERFDTKFGLIPRPPEHKADTWWVEAQPGNYMGFHPPWDTGTYDT